MSKVIAAISLLLLIATCGCSQVNQQAIADVAAGKLKEAKASWWGFNETDATACLQAAINSKAPKLIVDNVGKPWIVLPIKLVSNQEITFERGVEVLAKADKFKGGNDSLFSASNLDNITLTGYGATLRMRRNDYDDATRYQKAEWRHVLQFHSCSNIKVYGLILTESGGDGIYLGTGTAGVSNTNVHIKDVICDKNYRQGISVITADNLLIENTIMRDTAGTAPQAGIDFEPNGPDERIVNCVMRHCVAENNAGGGFVAYLSPLRASSAPVSLRLENCQAIGNQGDAFALITGNGPEDAVSGTVELIGCELRDGKRTGLMIGNNPPSGCRVLVRDCAIINAALAAPQDAPITLMATPGASQDVGGVRFERVLVNDPLGRNPMQFTDMVGGLQVAEITGNLILDKDGRKQSLELTRELLATWMPVMALKRIPRVKLAGLSFVPLQPLPAGQKYELGEWHLRQAGTVAVWAKQGEQVTVTINSGQVGNYATNPVSVVVTSPSGQEVTRVQAPFGQDYPVSFTAPETGLYTLRSDAGANYAYFTRSTHPFNLTGQPLHLIHSTGTLYFYVPPGTTEFGIRIHGEGTGEGVKASLMNAAGACVQEKDNIARTDMLTVELAQPSPGEVWTLKLERPSGMVMEDFHIDPLGIPGLLAPTKDALLKPVQ